MSAPDMRSAIEVPHDDDLVPATTVEGRETQRRLRGKPIGRDVIFKYRYSWVSARRTGQGSYSWENFTDFEAAIKKTTAAALRRKAAKEWRR